MKVVITGGTGMLGRRLALRLLAANELVGPSGRTEALEHLTLVDAFEPAEAPPEDLRVEIVSCPLIHEDLSGGQHRRLSPILQKERAEGRPRLGSQCGHR